MRNFYKGLNIMKNQIVASIANKITNDSAKDVFVTRQQYAEAMAQENQGALTQDSYNQLQWDEGVRKDLGLDNRTNSKSFQALLGVEMTKDAKEMRYEKIAVDHMDSNYRSTLAKGLSSCLHGNNKKPLVYMDTNNPQELKAVLDSNNPTASGVPYSALIDLMPRNLTFTALMRKLAMREYVGETVQAGSLWSSALEVLFIDYTMNNMDDITMYSDGDYSGYNDFNIEAKLLPIVRLQEAVSVGIEKQAIYSKVGIDALATLTARAYQSDKNKKDLMMTLGFAPAGIKGYLNWGIPVQDLPFPDLTNPYNVYANLTNILVGFLSSLKGYAGLDLEVKMIMPPAKYGMFLTIFDQFPLAVKNVIKSNLNFSFEQSSTLEKEVTGLAHDVMIATAYPKGITQPPSMELQTKELSPIGTPQTQGKQNTFFYMTQYTGLFIPYAQYVNIYNLAN